MNIRMGILAATITCLIAPSTIATEIITKRELKDGVLRTEMLVKVADNGIFLLDTSSSSNEEYTSGKSKIQAMKSELISRNSWFPDLGHKIGIYTYTDWQD